MNVNDQSCDDSLLPVFFPPHVHTSMRACLIYEGEGVGATDRRVWHMRTFPGATDMRPTHSPPYASGPVAMATSWSLGVRHLAMQNDEQTRVYKV